MPAAKKPDVSAFSRLITAEVRVGMARKRISGARLATTVGMSQNYLAKRLRDEAPLTLDDFAVLCEALDLDPREVLGRVVDTSEREAALLDETLARLLRVQEEIGGEVPSSAVPALREEMRQIAETMQHLERTHGGADSKIAQILERFAGPEAPAPVDLHAVNLADEYGLAATDDDTSVDPSRGEA